MPYNAKNGSIRRDDLNMDYIAFGNGSRAFIIIPGLGDGLRTVKGLAGTMSSMYRLFARDFRVYMFSRRNDLTAGYTSRDMARDLKTALGHLGILRADVLGVSQGGTIAQYLAADYPEAVNRLILAVTYARPNNTINQCINNWISLAEAGDYRSIFIDTSERSYTEKMLRKYRPLYPLLSRIGQPKSFERFIVLANACLSHNAADQLGCISAPTLVIGGDCDRIVGPDAAGELADMIPGSQLFIYPGLGHALYEEAPDFNHRVLDFLQSN